ncbi:DUF4406 domain-containing protein [Sinorhizobium medicae]|nr:DUF4406 domain-containing protein [Sinorhizobium medicae]
MSNHDVQATRRSNVNEAILQAWECAFGRTRVIYLSGPITTGRRKIDSIRNRDGVSADDITSQNCRILIEAANRLREERGDLVVEPASLQIPGWSQQQYLTLWGELIKRHAHLVIFMPDWEYSVGCVTEYAMAKAEGIPTATCSGKPLHSNEALELLSRARENIRTDIHHPQLKRLDDAIQATIRGIQINGIS